MQAEIKKDLIEEIMIKLDELERKIIKLLKIKNEKELSNPFVLRNRA